MSTRCECQHTGTCAHPEHRGEPMAARFPLTQEEMLDLADRLAADAQALRARITIGTAEEWNAYSCLEEAAARVHSAAAWLARHDEKLRERGKVEA